MIAQQMDTPMTLFGVGPAHGSTTCTRCHRPLSDPVSIQAGLGPICRGRLRAHDRDDAGDETGDRYDLPFDPATGDIICRRDPDGTKHFNVGQLVTYHSPTGMEWGYSGSGPSDFALSILSLFLPPSQAHGVMVIDDGGDRTGITSGVAWDLHHAFKAAFVAPLAEAGGTIRGDAIRAWLRARGVAA